MIELVMVIILLGILSIGGINLFSSSGSYATVLGKDVLIAQSLLAQQIGLGNSNSATPASLTIDVTAEAWTFTVNKTGTGLSESATIDSAGNSLVVDGTTVGAGGSRTFTWTNTGSLSGNTNHSLLFSGTNAARVCLSAEGYAYESGVACP